MACATPQRGRAAQILDDAFPSATTALPTGAVDPDPPNALLRVRLDPQPTERRAAA